MRLLPRLKDRAKKFGMDREGSFTLEALLVFPIILMLTFLLLFYALFTEQGALVYYKASVASDRTAYNWDNSAKDWRTGAYPEGRYDGLYWRMADDGVLGKLFGWGGQHSPEAVPFPTDDAFASPQPLSVRKLAAAAGKLTPLRGEMGHRDELLLQEVTADAELPAQLSALRRFRGSAVLTASAKVSAAIVEPEEWIRTFDLIRYYKAKMEQAGDGAGTFRSKAAAILSAWRNK